MENLGAMADSRYTGFHEITDHDILELHSTEKLTLTQTFHKYQISLCRTNNYWESDLNGKT